MNLACEWFIFNLKAVVVEEINRNAVLLKNHMGLLKTIINGSEYNY
jgi:hypothetical protein